MAAWDSPAQDSTIAEFRRALYDELQAARTGPSSDPVPLVHGRRIGRIRDAFHYRFEAEQELPRTLIEDAQAQLRLGADAQPVRVVEHEGLAVTLALTDDCGARIEEAALLWDLTFLLEELRGRLFTRLGEDNRGGELLVGARSAPSVQDDVELSGLNDGQAVAVAHALGSACSYIWGPPGTGKTRTIGALVAELVRRGRSVLLVSHTNVAIDEALLRSADALGDDLPDGEVLRLGVAYGPRLRARPRLLVETHVRERATELEEAIRHAEDARTVLREQTLAAHRVVELAAWLQGLPRGFQRLERLDRAVERAERDLTLAERDAAEREARESAASRLNRSGELRDAQIAFHQAHRDRYEHLDGLTDEPRRHGMLPDGRDADVVERLLKARAAAEAELHGASLADAQAAVEAINPRIAQLDRTVERFQQDIARLGDALVSEAQVVACTLTAAYLRRAISERRFDTVIIDEASIAPVPAAWFAANLCTRAVVAVGDFGQLPPIVLAETPLARKWLARDVFEVSGVREAYERGDSPPHLLPLTTQHRMAPEVSRLPNKLSYGGILRDAADTSDSSELEGWFDPASGADAPVSVVELCALHPWATTVRRGARTSRLNLMSAIAAVDVVSSMLVKDRRSPTEDEPRRGLIIAPYRPQAELLGAMLRARGLAEEITAGTIHAFQGSEASIVVLDMTVAEPHYRAALFSKQFDETHRRMLNVAVTRARRRLIVVADRPFIRQHAGEGTATKMLMRLLIGARELAVGTKMHLRASERLLEAVEASERDIVWFVSDADREPQLVAAIEVAARRGVNICVVTQSGRERQLGLRVAALTRLRDAGAAVLVKQPLRESLLLTDSRFVALRPNGLDGWSVWDEPSVSAHVARAQQVPELRRLALNEHHGGCPRCGDVVELREADHSGHGLYARCSSCRRSIAMNGRRPARGGDPFAAELA